MRTFVALVLVALGTTTTALAQEVRPQELDLGEIEARTEFLTTQLDERQLHAALWYYGWFGVSAGSLAYSATRAATTDDSDTRVLGYVEAGKSAIDILNLMLRPMPARFGASPVYDMPGGTRELELAKLREAERILAEDAKRAEFTTSVWSHLGNAFLNLAGGGIILAYGNATDAAISTGTGLLVGETRILTHPTQSIRDFDAYEKRYGGSLIDAGWSIDARPGGIQISYRF